MKIRIWGVCILVLENASSPARVQIKIEALGAVGQRKAVISPRDHVFDTRTTSGTQS
jgi:hypothetical protein